MAPKVFISYAWEEGKDYTDWVKNLASKLRADGVDCSVDMWDTKPGIDLTQFMEDSLSKANYIICIVSTLYSQKCNEAAPSGVYYEKRLLANDFLKCGNQGKIIPIVYNNPTKDIPRFLASCMYIDFRDEANYDENYSRLLKYIYEVSDKPPLGKNPFEKANATNQAIEDKLAIDRAKYTSPTLEGQANFDIKNNNGCFTIGTADNEFETMWSECGNHSVYCYKDRVKRIGYRADYNGDLCALSIEEINSFDFSSRARELPINECILLQNEYNKFALIRLNHIARPSTPYGHYIEFSYLIFDAKTDDTMHENTTILSEAML